MQAIRYLLVLLLPFLQKSYLQAQTIPLTIYNSNNGMPIDNVYAATQDADGFLWFAHDFGITRFDGNKFSNYNKKNGLKGTAVTDIIYAGKDSLIFIAYPKSIQCILKNGNVYTIEENTNLPFHQITRHENQFYFVHRNNPEYGIWNHKKFTYIKGDSAFGIPGLKINAIFSMGEKGLGYCTNKGLIVQKNGQLTNYLKNKDVQLGMLQKNKNILLVYNNQLSYFQENGIMENTPWKLPVNFNPYHIEETNDGIWIRNINNGLYKLENHQLMEMSELLGLKNNSVHEFFKDMDGNLWICTNGKGVIFRKKMLLKNYNIENGLPNNEVLNLYQQEQRLFIGTANGIGIKTETKIQTLPLPVAKEGLQYTYQIFQADYGRTGLSIGRTFNFIKNNRSNYTLEYQKAYLAVNAMFAWQENNNHLWLFEGPGAKKLIKIENREKERWIDIGSYEINRIHRMIFWESEYWVGTNKGFLRLKNNNIRFIDSLEKEKTGEVFDFLIDRKNRLWMATETGLFYFDKENMFTVPKSISQLGNYCKSITEDDQGIIWCATWDGIFSYDGIQKITYSTSAGISAKKTNVVLFDSVKKELLIGNINGLDVFPIKQKELFKINKPVFIEANINDSTNKKIFTGIVLDPQQNDLKFYLSIPFFNREVPITYAYKLDDGVWNSSTNPEIILKNITSGYHVFYAKARINETWITESTTKFVFTIKTPFYKTWWFIAAMVILGQLILFFIINHFNRKAKEKKINLMQKDAEFAALKQKAFTALLNPHFIFNALNSIQFYINKNDRQNANKYLSDFASLIRKNFDAAQDAFINLEDELDNLRLYLQLEQMRFTNKFNYSFIVAEEVQTEDWMIPSMVLQPLLENAILHGLMPLQKAGNLYIRIEEKNKKLQIIIEDDGIGIEKSKALKSGGKHKSKGMQLIRERLMILAKITKEPLLFTIANASETKETKGTTITLSLPPDLFMEFEKHSAALKEL